MRKPSALIALLGLCLALSSSAEVHLQLPEDVKSKGSEKKSASGEKEVKWNELSALDYRTGKAPKEVKSLNGQTVKIPGYMIPLEDSDQAVTEFLLVPSVPSCVHIPPPPPNQIIHIKMKKGSKAKVEWKPIWVVGKIKVATGKKAMTEASYEMEGLKTEPFTY